MCAEEEGEATRGPPGLHGELTDARADPAFTFVLLKALRCES